MDNSSTLRTSVSPTLLRWRLYAGSLIAGSGGLILLLPTIYFSTAELEKWGVGILILGLSLIALGLIPYRRLQRLETKPNELIVSTNGLSYYKAGKLQWKLPFDSIRYLGYEESNWSYGIVIDVEGRFDLYLPYFTKRSFQIVEEAYKAHRQKL